MNVLLLSRNRTVSEMIALAFRGKNEAHLVVSEGIGSVKEGVPYDVMIVDDTLTEFRETRDLAKRLGIAHTVLLSRMEALSEPGFERQIYKPFLPSEIESFIEEYTQTFGMTGGRSNRGFRSEAEVLNLEEIGTIKSLLEEEGLEIVNEEELAERVIDDESEALSQNEALLEALRTMKPKKIRELLRGARIHIDITFPTHT